MINKKQKLQRLTRSAVRGFTLVETLLAVLLLSVAIAGPLTIASKGLLSAISAKEQIVAFYLGQDAIEYIRFKRDTNCLAAAGAPASCPAGSWLSGLSSCISTDGSALCQIDSIQDTATSCTGTCSPLNFDSTTGYYGYSAGSITGPRYIRTVKIITPFGGNSSQARVVVTMTWATSGLQHTITMKEDIINWQ